MFIQEIIVGISTNLISDIITNKFNRTKTKNKILAKKRFSVDKSINSDKKNEYKYEISERLKFSIQLINKLKENITFSFLNEKLLFSSVSEIEDFFLGKKEPTEDFLNKYSKYFGFEVNWLKHGIGNTFKINELYESDPLEYSKAIKALSPIEIYFVRAESEYGNSGIILKLSDFEYLVLKRTYQICSSVGATGKIKLANLYELIKNLSNIKDGINLSGVLLTNEQFSKVFNGNLYFGNIIENIKSMDYWWEDFMDYNHSKPIAMYYEIQYGKEFIEAQKIVKRQKETKVL
jgi:hypothetical protein